jgi:hypothetical protein
MTEVNCVAIFLFLLCAMVRSSLLFPLKRAVRFAGITITIVVVVSGWRSSGGSF